MEHYVTLFDSLFLPQGLALHMSMERHLKNYQLWILCVDDEVFEVLRKLNLNNVRLLQLSKLETDELLKVKTERSKGEYCWTLTPFAPRFVFEDDQSVARVTYLDADLWFRKSPKPIFDELNQSGKHVLITDHGYAPEHDQSLNSGQYCVQFITFTRLGGELVRRKWELDCLDWCYCQFLPGKFGDQKYLEKWISLYADLVHVLRDKELALAPWNVSRFPYGHSIFFHFHGLRVAKNKRVYFGDYEIPDSVIQNVYIPYLKDLKTGCNRLAEVNFRIKPQTNLSFHHYYLRRLYRIIFKRLASIFLSVSSSIK